MTASHNPKAKASLGKAMLAESVDKITRCLSAEGIPHAAPASVMLSLHDVFEIARDRWGLEGILFLTVAMDVYRNEIAAADAVASEISEHSNVAAAPLAL